MLRSYLLRGINRTNGCNVQKLLLLYTLPSHSKLPQTDDCVRFRDKLCVLNTEPITEIRLPTGPLPAQAPLPGLLPEPVPDLSRAPD